jgi:hypothetical protein
VAKRTFTKFSKAHHKLENFRAMPSRLGSFTSKSKTMLQALLDVVQSAQGLGLMFTCSHNLNLSTQLKDFASKVWISQREVEESSNWCLNAIHKVRNQHQIMEGVEALIQAM